MHVQHLLCTLKATTDNIGRKIAVELHNVISFAGLCLQRTSLLNFDSTILLVIAFCDGLEIVVDLLLGAIACCKQALLQVMTIWFHEGSLT